jgi:tetratricopeptide (TPR) repeat protein
MGMKPIYWSLLFALVLVISPALAVTDDTSQENNAWYWYNNAVDLANAGKFSEALVANEKALSINQAMPVAWANEAGILVQLGRYEEAITAADTVLSVNNTEMPNTYAAAYYSKGDALRGLGRTADAQDAYKKAFMLDNTLVPPDISRDITPSSPQSSAVTLPQTTGQLQRPDQPSSPATYLPVTTPQSSLPVFAGISAVLIAIVLCALFRKSPG